MYRIPNQYNMKMNGKIKQHFGNCMTSDTKLRPHNISSESALFYGSRTWIINKTDAQNTEIFKTGTYNTGPPKEL
jgi:hypothetical protein